MGGLVSRWRHKQSTEDVLQELTKKIKALEEMQKINVAKQKRLIGRLVVAAIIAYVIAALWFCLANMPTSIMDKVQHSSIFVVLTIFVWLMHRFLHWYFVKRIVKNEAALQQLKDKRNKILEDVMENETYKKAKEILEKYDPDRFKPIEDSSINTPAVKSPDGQDLRKRNLQSTTIKVVSATPGPMPQGRGQLHMTTPTGPPRVGGEQRMMPPGSVQVGRSINGRRNGVETGPPGPPMPRPVLPRERTLMDKLVDYLIGDGPQNRYALICKECQSHNGMAVREEYEYINFRCCYCYSMNPAKKQRPYAPRLEQMPPKPDSTQGQDEGSNTEPKKEEAEAEDNDAGEDSISNKAEEKKTN